MSNSYNSPRMNGSSFGFYNNAAIAVWGKIADGFEPTLAEQERLAQYVASQNPQGVVICVVVLQGSPMPDGAKRKQLDAFFARWAPSCRAVLFIAEGSDLWSVTARSVMSAMSLVKKKPYPTKVLAEPGEGARWAAEYVSKTEGHDGPEHLRALHDKIQELRKAAS